MQKSRASRRTELIRTAIDEYINRTKIEEAKQKNGTEMQKIYSVITELNNNVLSVQKELALLTDENTNNNPIIQKMGGGFRVIARAIVASNPERKNDLKVVLKDPKIWEGL